MTNITALDIRVEDYVIVGEKQGYVVYKDDNNKIITIVFNEGPKSGDKFEYDNLPKGLKVISAQEVVEKAGIDLNSPVGLNFFDEKLVPDGMQIYTVIEYGYIKGKFLHPGSTDDFAREKYIGKDLGYKGDKDEFLF